MITALHSRLCVSVREKRTATTVSLRIERACMYESECDSTAALEYESIREKASGSLRAVYGRNEREGTRLKWRH